MLNKNVQTFLACDTPYRDAHTVLFGAAFDSTTSFRPGTRFGSDAARRESYGLESYSPYQDADLAVMGGVFDSGDPELCIGNSATALRQIGQRTKRILDDNKRPFMIGGEHLVTLGAVREVVKKYPDLVIIHMDAHADLRDDYLGVKLSHACIIRRCWELVGDGRIHQFGIRSGDRTEWAWGKSHVDTHPFGFAGLQEVVAALGDTPVYLTVDLDVLDPSVFPGTGTPEPGGVTFDALRNAVEHVCTRCNVVGCDVNELSPHYDASGASTAVTCKIIREMLIAFALRQSPSDTGSVQE